MKNYSHKWLLRSLVAILFLTTGCDGCNNAYDNLQRDLSRNEKKTKHLEEELEKLKAEKKDPPPPSPQVPSGAGIPGPKGDSGDIDQLLNHEIIKKLIKDVADLTKRLDNLKIAGVQDLQAALKKLADDIKNLPKDYMKEPEVEQLINDAINKLPPAGAPPDLKDYLDQAQVWQLIEDAKNDLINNAIKETMNVATSIQASLLVFIDQQGFKLVPQADKTFKVEKK